MGKYFDSLDNKNVAFIGCGVAHKELVPLFAKAGARVTLCDKQPLSSLGDYGDELLAIGVRLSLGDNYLDGLEGQDIILRTPGFDFFNPVLQAAIRKGVQVTSEIELFLENCPCKTIGITGSDGKTTTSSVIAAIFEADGKAVHLGGNIGRSMLPVVDEIQPEDIAVVELSSFQLISMRHSPDIAVVTNVTPNHLDHHKDMQEYIDAKRNILLWQSPESVSVLGYENGVTRQMDKDVKGSLRWFTRLGKVEEGAFLDESGYLCVVEKGQPVQVVHKSMVKLPGEHNVENLLAAFAAVRDEASTIAMEKVAKEFSGVTHRIEFVREIGGVRWYNDSIATSPSRVIAGLRAFSSKVVLIAGGSDKNIPFDPMVPDIIRNVKLLVLTGPSAPKIEQAVRQAEGFDSSGVEIVHASGMEDAISTAKSKTSNGDIVLLSPACASFDAYSNFEARGIHFKELVQQL